MNHLVLQTAEWIASNLKTPNNAEPGRKYEQAVTIQDPEVERGVSELLRAAEFLVVLDELTLVTHICWRAGELPERLATLRRNLAAIRTEARLKELERDR